SARPRCRRATRSAWGPTGRCCASWARRPLCLAPLSPRGRGGSCRRGLRPPTCRPRSPGGAGSYQTPARTGKGRGKPTRAGGAMQTRHRIPTVFTLYMVDVFCCALGCVILLWLASARDAQRKGTAHEQAAKQLADTRLRLASSRSELTALQAARVAIEQDRDRLRG